MLVALSDTHGTDDPRLTAHLRGVLREAELVVHTGDFTTPAVLESFETEARRFVAVYGNSDSTAICERLPETRTVEWGGRRFVLAHGHRHDRTALSLLARQEQADIAVVGHTHRPGIQEWGERQQESGMWQGNNPVVVNPGSHADPREGQPTYAAFEQTEGGMVAMLCLDGGQAFETVEL